MIRSPPSDGSTSFLPRPSALRLVRTYRIVYQIEDKRVEIVTVFEGHQLLPDDVK